MLKGFGWLILNIVTLALVPIWAPLLLLWCCAKYIYKEGVKEIFDDLFGFKDLM